MALKIRFQLLPILLLAFGLAHNSSGAPSRKVLPGHVPEVAARLTPSGRVAATNRIALSLGLPLRNAPELEQLLADLYNPASSNFHKFLTSQEFTARFGPTERDYAAVQAFARSSGFKVIHTHANRLVLDVEGNAAEIEQTFEVTLQAYRHPSESRNFFAPSTKPSVPTNVPVADMWGLSDFSRPQPLARKMMTLTNTPLNYNGSGPDGSYRGTDFRNAYATGSSLVGSGQIVAMAEFDGYYASDITTYIAQSGYSNVTLQNVLLNGVSGTPGYSGQGANAIAEVSLDIELAIAMAPGMSKLMVYEGSSPYTVFNQMAADNTAKQISCSWAWNTGPTHKWIPGPATTLDSILSQMVAQGQAFFQASGDSDAYTGTQALSSSSGPIPVDSIYVTSVGGTTLTMTGGGASWSSETVWNWGNNVGGGGGISPNYSIPSWQTNVSMAANNGSTVNRNIPDVAMTADAVYVIYNNGSIGYFGGTSCAAPLWAGFCALVNQQAVTTSGQTVGFLNPALYAIAAGTNYTNCFHDTTTGNNIGSNTPGLYNAVTNYDLATGLGTPNGVSLINALAPSPPYFLTQPVGKIATNGATINLSASAGGSSPLAYQWRLNSTNLPAGGNLSGVASNILTITSATTNNAGNYQLVATNTYGKATSSVAVVTIGFPPQISAQPSSLFVLSGSNATFTSIATGSQPLAYQWRKNSTNLVNGAGVSGATSNVLTLSSVTTSNSGNYTLQVTNAFGIVTSSVAALTVVLPPSLTSTSMTNRTVECGANTNSLAITVAGTTPLQIQWSLDGTPIPGATNTGLLLTNLHLPNHTVSVLVTNAYGTASSNALITVQDTLAPSIILNGTNPTVLELGATFSDAGATASDTCSGPVTAPASGSVNTNAIGTNILTYTANDGNGQTNSTTRTVIVRDTTPPTITWSFTNLAQAATTNCSVAMPDVTGTNFIRATDVSGTLAISQNPTAASLLPTGTNLVVITVQDPSSNAAYSTNFITVLNQTPPVIVSSPQSQTNVVGSTAIFSVSASACTPLAFQWLRNNATLVAQTNSTLTLSNLVASSAGDYSAIATANGGSSTSAVATLTVNLLPSTTTLTSSVNPSGYGDAVQFTAQISPTNATGTVQVFTNGTLFEARSLANGIASSTSTTTLPRGTNTVLALYSGDASYLSSSNLLSQAITNHPPIGAPASYTCTNGTPLNIVIADLATNWSDTDNDTISLLAVGISTNGIVLTNTGSALTYFTTNAVADQFTCTIADGFGGTNYQLVSISPTPAPDLTPYFSGIIISPSNGATLSIGGANGSTYILETTTDLLSYVSWLPVATNTLATNFWQFTDFDATNHPQGFYRLKLSP